jgi:hypothetical protein
VQWLGKRERLDAGGGREIVAFGGSVTIQDKRHPKSYDEHSSAGRVF